MSRRADIDDVLLHEMHEEELRAWVRSLRRLQSQFAEKIVCEYMRNDRLEERNARLRARLYSEKPGLLRRVWTFLKTRFRSEEAGDG